jgi:hypothetical protein
MGRNLYLVGHIVENATVFQLPPVQLIYLCVRFPQATFRWHARTNSSGRCPLQGPDFAVFHDL